MECRLCCTPPPSRHTPCKLRLRTWGCRERSERPGWLFGDLQACTRYPLAHPRKHMQMHRLPRCSSPTSGSPLCVLPLSHAHVFSLPGYSSMVVRAGKARGTVTLVQLMGSPPGAVLSPKSLPESCSSRKRGKAPCEPQAAGSAPAAAAAAVGWLACSVTRRLGSAAQSACDAHSSSH